MVVCGTGAAFGEALDDRNKSSIEAEHDCLKGGTSFSWNEVSDVIDCKLLSPNQCGRGANDQKCIWGDDFALASQI